MTERPRLRSPPQPPSRELLAYQQLTNYFSDVVPIFPTEESSPEGDEMKRKRLQIVENQIKAYKKKV